MFLCPVPKKLELKGGYYRFPSDSNPRITESISSSLCIKESYTVKIDENGIFLEGADESGLHYAHVTLDQLMKNYRGCLPFLTIYDKPDYSYRGFMIDVCRHFFTVDELKKMISAAAYFKFNKFHFHLSDDQGFRLEIESYPQLTAVGSVRYASHFGKAHYDNEIYGGYYTKKELREIVDFCKALHIDIIPEFDVPGHTSAVIAAYPEFSCTGKKINPQITNGIFKDVLCVGNDDALKMVYSVFDEICEIFPGEYIHIGGDEVPKAHWNNCPKCQAMRKGLNLSNMEELQGYITNEISLYLKKKGKKAICWNEAIRGENIPFDNLTVAWWMDKTDASLNWANRGNPTIIESFFPYYADYPYGMHSLKDVYMFNPTKIKGLTDLGRGSIIGVESPIWTEFVPDFNKMAQMCFPRWLAVANTGWSGNKSRDYNKFLKTCKFFCEILKEKGIPCAPQDEWNNLPHTRLSHTLGFLTNFLSKDSVKNMLENLND